MSKQIPTISVQIMIPNHKKGAIVRNKWFLFVLASWLLASCSNRVASAANDVNTTSSDASEIITTTAISTVMVADTTITETTTVDTPESTPFSEKVVRTACSIYLQGGTFSDVLRLILDARISHEEKMVLVKSVEVGTYRLCPSLNTFSS